MFIVVLFVFYSGEHP